SASLQYAFSQTKKERSDQIGDAQLRELAEACFTACLTSGNTDILFEEAFQHFEDAKKEGIFLETLESYILDQQINQLPATVIKSLVSHYASQNLECRLEEMICHMETATMDLDQLTILC